MTELAKQIAELREIVGRMTPGEWFEGHNRSDNGGIYRVIETEGNFEDVLGEYGLARDEDHAGIVALRNTALPIIDAQAAEIAALRAELDEQARVNGMKAEIERLERAFSRARVMLPILERAAALTPKEVDNG